MDMEFLTGMNIVLMLMNIGMVLYTHTAHAYKHHMLTDINNSQINKHESNIHSNHCDINNTVNEDDENNTENDENDADGITYFS